MHAPTGTDAGLKSLAVCSNKFAPVFFAPRMRNKFAPIHVACDVEKIRLVAIPSDSLAKIVVNGVSLINGKESDEFILNYGRNIFNVIVIAADNKTEAVFTTCIFRDYAGPQWRKVSDNNKWISRDSAGELVYRNKMWLIGGYTPATAKDVWCSKDGINWTCTGEISGSKKGIDIPLTFVFKDKMWVVDLDGMLFSSSDGTNWRLINENPPWKGRHQAGGVVFKGKMWVMGGKAKNKYLNDVWSSEDGINWRQETNDADWSPRLFHNTPLVLDSKIWIIGGAVMGDYYPFRAYTDVWCSSNGRKWEKVTDSAPWVGRIWSSTTVYKNRLWLLGGFRSEPVWENLGDVWYSADGETWHQMEFLPTCRHGGGNNTAVVVNNSIWAPRHEMSVYVLSDKLWVVGGMVWPLMNDVWSLEISGLTFVTQPVIEDFVGTLYEYRARADFNISRAPIQYRLINSPSWLSINRWTGIIEGTAPSTGDFPVTVEAFDSAGEKVQQSYVLHILPVE